MKIEKNMKVCKIVQWLTYLVGVLSIILPAILWSKIPQEIPSHYGVSGKADQFSDKGILILLFIIVAFLMGMMAITTYVVKINMVSKHTKDAERSQNERIYPLLVFMNFAIQCVFAYIIFCACTSRNLGTYALLCMLILVFLPLIGMIVWGRRRSEKTVDITAEQTECGVVYRSKADWWLAIMLGGTLVYLAYLSIEMLVKNSGMKWFMLGTFMLVLLVLLPLFQIKYVFYSTHLLVSCGMYGKERIAYGEIRGVKETKNPLSSAALSLDRIQIDYEKNGIHHMVLISPVRKKEFIARLKENMIMEEI